MQKIQNLLKGCMGCFRKVSKKAYATCAIITAGSVIIAVIAMTRTDFGGSGKNNIRMDANNVQVYTAGEDEDDDAEVDQYFSTLTANLNNSGKIFDQSLVEFIKEDEVIIPREMGNSTSQGSVTTLDNSTEEVYSLPLGLAINKLDFEVTEEDYNALLRIVEAEATSEDLKGRILIANVVFNRVRWSGFPDTVYEVIYQENNGKYQFSPLSDGRFYTVEVSEITRKAVELALDGIDYSDGALFFAARSMANPNSMKWFDTKLNYLFEYGVHEFFNYN
ncbi:MAG: sleB 2 [Clostridiales bacterium]|nr:sleB 2 [Clostridiales bacterium]